MADRPTGAIVGAAIGYRFTDVEPFVRSVRDSGFAGPIVLILDRKLPQEDLRALADLGVTADLVWNNSWIVRGDAPRARLARLALRSPVGRAVLRRSSQARRLTLQSATNRRFLLYTELLARHAALFEGTDWIFLTDIRDVHVQHDPTEGFERLVASSPLHLYAEGPPDAADGVFRIAEATNTHRWIRGLAGDEVAERLAPERVICSGTILVATSSLGDLADRMREPLARLDPGTQTFGFDQGALNLLYYTGALDDLAPVVHDNGDGGLATIAAVKEQDCWTFDGDQLQMAGVVPDIVHQYDRVPALRARWA